MHGSVNLNGASVSILDGFDLSLKDSELGMATITNAGDNTVVTVTALESDADESGIPNSSLATTLDNDSVMTLGAASDLNGAMLSLSSSDALDENGLATVVGSSFVVGTSYTILRSATKLSGIDNIESGSTTLSIYIMHRQPTYLQLVPSMPLQLSHETIHL